MNLASYTAWEWRWRCVEAAGCAPEALAAEARLLADLAAASPKNYQLWNHRRRLALQRGPAHAAEVRPLGGRAGFCMSGMGSWEGTVAAPLALAATGVLR